MRPLLVIVGGRLVVHRWPTGVTVVMTSTLIEAVRAFPPSSTRSGWRRCTSSPAGRQPGTRHYRHHHDRRGRNSDPEEPDDQECEAADAANRPPPNPDVRLIRPSRMCATMDLAFTFSIRREERY